MEGWANTPTDSYELAGIPRRTVQVQEFFTAYDHWNPEVDDGEELREMEHLLGISEREWAEHRQSVAVEF